jgi:hypothetical protein
MATNEAESSRKSRAAKAASKTDSHAVEVEETMAEQDKTTHEDGPAKAGKLELAQKPKPVDELAQKPKPADGQAETGLALRDDSGDIEVAESFTAAGLRPIAASHLDVYGTIMNNRPVMASHLRVVEYAGNRPIFANDVTFRDDLSLPGGRPIAASDPKLLQASQIMNARPIASNEIDDNRSLMGYID